MTSAPQSNTPEMPFNMAEQIDIARITAESTKAIQEFASHHQNTMNLMAPIMRGFAELAQHYVEDPQSWMRLQMDIYQSHMALWANVAEQMLGNSTTPLAQPQKGDRRFKNSAWEENFLFDFIKQSYLLTTNAVLHSVGEANMDEAKKAKVSFYTQQFLDSVAPSNFPMTNPDVIEATISSKGDNLVTGLKNILRDLERGNGNLKISMTDYDAFEVGKNLAVTPGKVVFRNRMIELIQYAPSTEKVYEKPLLISPPWINKYYILDLQSENSFVKYAVDQGFQVFLISWKNVDETYRDTNFEDYMTDGLSQAIDVALNITKQDSLNAIGYCIGGTLLGAALAVFKAKGDTRVNSATFFTTLMNFENAGELKLFTDQEQLDALDQRMAAKGYLDGAEMAQTFSMLRSNDLIWSFVVNNYMLGKEPMPFDLLYWNDDPTRMPAAMHSYYLRNMYLENNLCKPGKLNMAGVPVDLTQIDTPIYMLSAQSDHITPWQSCFSVLPDMAGKEKRFVLSKAGHVAGVVNPPGNAKRAYWAAEVGRFKNPESWLEKAEQQQDSWWPDWSAWVASRSGNQVAARKTQGNINHKPLCDAPGTYVVEN